MSIPAFQRTFGGIDPIEIQPPAHRTREDGRHLVAEDAGRSLCCAFSEVVRAGEWPHRWQVSRAARA